MPVEGLINLLLLVRWPVVHTDGNVTLTSLSLDSNPQAFNFPQHGPEDVYIRQHNENKTPKS